jgi:hypothetical protein
MNIGAPPRPRGLEVPLLVDQVLRACADNVAAERELHRVIGQQLADARRAGVPWRLIAARVDLVLGTAFNRAQPYLQAEVSGEHPPETTKAP